jgi:purine-binding chemotaxis protein CheW
MIGQASVTPAGATLQFLSFRSGGEECAMELPRVREILRYETLTRVPRAPAFVRGVLNLRGNVVPVVDLAVGLRLPAAPVGSRTCILIVELAIEGEPTIVGLVVAEVSRVLELTAEDVEAPPSFGTRVPVSVLKGVTRVDGKFVLLLDLDRLLGDGSLLGFGRAGAAVRDEGGA